MRNNISYQGKKEKHFIIKTEEAYLLEEIVQTRSAFSQHSCWLWGKGSDSLSLHPKVNCDSLPQSLAHLIFNQTLGCLDPWFRCCGASYQIWRESPNSQWLPEQPQCLVQWVLNLTIVCSQPPRNQQSCVWNSVPLHNLSASSWTVWKLNGLFRISVTELSQTNTLSFKTLKRA